MAARLHRELSIRCGYRRMMASRLPGFTPAATSSIKGSVETIEMDVRLAPADWEKFQSLLASLRSRSFAAAHSASFSSRSRSSKPGSDSIEPLPVRCSDVVRG